MSKPRRNHRLPALTTLSAEEIAKIAGLPVFRGRQIRAWVMDRVVSSFKEMTDLPLDLREKLPGMFRLTTAERHYASRSPGGTSKLLLKMEDGALVECVLIPEGKRLTICISSQVGCPAGCAFCASGMNGLQRSLKAHEILEEFLLAAREAGGREKITNVVMMGMGEPLLNYDNVVEAVRSFDLSARRITISTVGLPDRMRRLAGEQFPVNLAVSLHAPDDETRNRLVPVNRKFGITEVIAAARYYFEETGRDVTFEYILIEGENASLSHAAQLSKLLTGGNLNVNLIPMNPVPDLPFRPPTREAVDAFRDHLREAKIPTHVRRPRGREIDAACGQLRRRMTT